MNIPYVHQRHGTVSGQPPHHYRMPRSGSAGAGFGCGNSDHPSAGFSPSWREHNLDLFDLQPQQQQFPSPAARGLPRTVTGLLLGANQPMTSDWNPPPSNQAGGNHPTAMLLPGNMRPMSNSFSANDLAAYHNQNRLIDIRSTKSSFELAPELPFEPNLTLLHGSTFYAKIAVSVRKRSWLLWNECAVVAISVSLNGLQILSSTNFALHKENKNCDNDDLYLAIFD